MSYSCCNNNIDKDELSKINNIDNLFKLFMNIQDKKKDPIDYKTKSFNLSEAKYYLYNILKNQEKNNIKKLIE